jgi:hypothetical protein
MFIDKLKDYIDTNTTFTFGSTLFIGNMPEGVTKCVVLQQGNADYIYNMNNVKGYTVQNITVRIRGDQTENTTRALAETIENLLENLTTSFTGFKLIRGAFETPMYQLDGTDQNNNYIYVGIYQCVIELA